jgi:hypothetical protein
MKKATFALLLGVLLVVNPARVAEAVDANAAAMASALNLYNQKNYAGAADAFEAICRTASPNARLYYYIILASNGCGRNGRAKQLAQYLKQNFPNSQEAISAARLYPEISQPAKGASDGLPDSIKKALSPQMQALLATDAGKAAMEKVIKEQSSNLETIRKAEQQGIVIKPQAVAAAMVPPKPAKGEKRAEHPFTAEDIAKDGAAGIDQSRHPNCWFEASMSALAELPRGQRLLASMIRSAKDDDYVVRFPNDGVEYVITPKAIQDSGIHDKALWATLIECAQIRKFPNNEGAAGDYNDQSRLEIGLGCITGCKAEILLMRQATDEQIASFVGGAITSNNPIVAGTYGESYYSGMPLLAVPQHAFTIVGFDAAKRMVIFRNPWGRNPNYSLPGDTAHTQFEMLDDGKFKMSVSLVQKYFGQLARSFI